MNKDKTQKINRAYYIDTRRKNKIVEDLKNNFSLIADNKIFFKNIKCPKCFSEFLFSSEKDLYKCRKCNYEMSIIEYQKRFINLNWFKSLEIGVKLYSWDSICFNCKNNNPCISYCINQSFGDEQLCGYKPLLLGSVAKLDNFVMKFCRTVNLFPDKNQNLIATMFCEKCDAPYSYEYLTQTFLDQTILDIEFNMKENVLKDIVKLKVTDITKLLNNIEPLESSND